MQKTKGFTIIELLVVIAIIAVLSAVVLVNVTGYIGRGKDAAVQGDLGTFVTAALTIQQDEGSYATVCDVGTDSGDAYAAAVSASGKTGHNNCVDSADAFAACVELNAATGKAWCVDSTGAKLQITSTNCTAATTSCAYVVPVP